MDRFPENVGDFSEKQMERFHQDIKMEEKYQARWNRHMMANYCWSLQNACPVNTKENNTNNIFLSINFYHPNQLILFFLVYNVKSFRFLLWYDLTWFVGTLLNSLLFVFFLNISLKGSKIYEFKITSNIKSEIS